MRSPVEICDVAPRDGLQNLSRQFSVPEKTELINRLVQAGLSRIEAGSFVNPRRVPQMAGTEDVLSRIDRKHGVRIAGLAMNERGVERALVADVDEIRFVIVASDTLSVKNQGDTPKRSLELFKRMAPDIAASEKTATAAIAAAFGCPFEGPVPIDRVIGFAAAAAEAGADEIMFADTIGAGVPAQVSELCAKTVDSIGSLPFGFHFHNTRNTGYANAVAAIQGGASVLDASIGGIGGCPFAPNATGNIATEDLFYLLRQSGIETGLSGTALLDTANWLGSLVPAEVSGQMTRAGFFPEVARPYQEHQARS